MLVNEVIMILHENVNNPSKLRSNIYLKNQKRYVKPFFRNHSFTAKMQTSLNLTLTQNTFQGQTHFKLCKGTVVRLNYNKQKIFFLNFEAKKTLALKWEKAHFWYCPVKNVLQIFTVFDVSGFCQRKMLPNVFI